MGTYGPPMQMGRFGMQDQIFDMIDEAKLPPSQIKTFCEALLGCPSLPEPELDQQAFLTAIDEALALQPNVFRPNERRGAAVDQDGHAQGPARLREEAPSAPTR